ncbi:MAG TPA: dihydrofolate reductase family protein [Candidatus Acidoferrales bacterium]|jgi:2,5-diamino-6-(ribosylamino)-4(3H)-pyrimidinone 5'-phosphate reductase|nr:dihydrofolate reductase family protein [Candidatus Acidoferrales bacterium]
MDVKDSKLPFVFSNFAMTADGKIAFASREFVPFGSDRDRENMMELRATADAVMSGARTVETPGVTLGPGGKKFQRLRLKRGLAEYNLRVIVTGSGSLDLGADVFKHGFSPIIVLVSQSAPARRVEQLRRAADDVGIFGETEIDFRSALRWLYKKWNVKQLLCEGGGAVHEAVIRAGLLDELHLTMCPVIFGGRTAPTVAEGPGFGSLAAAKRLRLARMRRVGNELFAVFNRAKPA